MSLCNRWAGALAALVVALVVGVPTAQAQTKPFKIIGTGEGAHGLPGPGQDPREHTAEGTATHLGRYSGVGSVRTLAITGVNEEGYPIGTFESGSPFVFTGANGDQLVTDYGHGENVGTFTLVPAAEEGYFVAYWIADFIPTAASTGKFAGVTGGWTMYAISDPFRPGFDEPLTYSWRGEGYLTFVKAKATKKKK
jgi:hypothetical protein